MDVFKEVFKRESGAVQTSFNQLGFQDDSALIDAVVIGVFAAMFQRLREINENYPNISMLIDMIQKKLAEETSQ